MSRTAFTRDHAAFSPLLRQEIQTIDASIAKQSQGLSLVLSLWPALDPEIPNSMHLQLGNDDVVSGPFKAAGLLLPLADASVSAICLQHVLDFATEPEELLAEAVRCLKGHGELTMFGVRAWSAAHISQRWRAQRPNLIAPSTWLRTCRALGLSDIEVSYFGVGWPWLKRLDTSIATVLARSVPNVASLYRLRAVKRGVRGLTQRVLLRRTLSQGARLTASSQSKISDHAP
jgi:SAM-dependent methyltransferase